MINPNTGEYQEINTNFEDSSSSYDSYNPLIMFIIVFIVISITLFYVISNSVKILKKKDSN